MSRHPVTVWDQDPRGFAFSSDGCDFIGRDALILARHLNETDIRTRFGRYFVSIENLLPVTITRNGRPEFEVGLYLARFMRSVYPVPYSAR